MTDQTAELLSAKQVGVELNMPHLEVIRRIRKKQIHARKVGWFYVITPEEVERVKTQDWYQRYKLS